MKIKKAPRYFVEIVNYANKILDKSLQDEMGLSLSWFDQNKDKNGIFSEKFKKLDEDKKFMIKSYLKFRSLSYDYAWAKFRISNIKNEWGKAELLDYNVDKETIKMEEGLTKMIKKFKRQIEKKFGKHKITIK